MRQSSAVLGRLSRLTAYSAQATQPLQVLARFTGADDGIIPSSTLNRFLSSAVADTAHQALPSSASVSHQSSVESAEGTPDTAAQTDPTDLSNTAASLHGAESESSADQVVSSTVPKGASQKGRSNHAQQLKQQQRGAPADLKMTVKQLEVEMDSLLKQRKPGTH